MPNYSYLKTDLINTTENDSTEFASQVSAIVYKTEIRMVKDLDDAGLNDESTDLIFAMADGEEPETLSDDVLVQLLQVYKEVIQECKVELQD